MSAMKKQKGYTLLELLIAGMLGLFLFLGVMNMFLSSSKTTTLQTAVADVQERSRFINTYLSNEFGRAGWLDPSQSGNAPVAVTFGTDETGEDTTVCNVGVSATDSCDRITIAYNGIRDCLGAEVNGGSIGTVTNTYFVENGELRCEGNSNTDIILNDVDSFQLLYALDDSDGAGLPYTSNLDLKDGIIDRYVEAYNFNTSGREVLMGVRFAILLRSAEQNAFDQAVQRTFTLFNEDALTYEDRRFRILVTGTSRIANAN